jgi:drug/metabolite transporter (DMT)-like permease
MSESTAIFKPQANLLADISLILVALIWGINMPVMKHAITELDPYLFNAYRLSLSAMVLGICAWLEQKSRGSTHKPASQRLTRLQSFFIMIGFSFLTGAVYQIIFVMGMDRTTAGNTALIMSSIPMWTAIVSVILLREALGAVAWIGLGISFLGTAIVTLQKTGVDISSVNLAGNLLVLVAALAWAIAAVISRPILSYMSPIKLAFLATTGTLPIHFVATYFLSEQGFVQSFDWTTSICIFYSGVFSTGFAYAMWNYGVKQIGASHAAVFQNLVPLVALICSWFFLGEYASIVQLVGGALIIAGLFVVRRNRAR